jgi:phage/conjugal plasmid C-4 type zinc finger TraR family protein
VSKGFGDSDHAQVLSDRATSQSIEHVLAQDREQADHARELQAKGAYGVCEDCGKKIAPERLAALPDSTRCVSCQAGWEGSNRR